jgi:hypothetical protein
LVARIAIRLIIILNIGDILLAITSPSCTSP